MDEEPGGNDVSRDLRTTHYDISKLLLGPELVKDGLLEELHRHHVQKDDFTFASSVVKTVLVKRNEARVLVFGVSHSEVKSVESSSLRSQIDKCHIWKALFHHRFQPDSLDCPLNDFSSIFLSEVSICEPNHVARLEPSFLHLFEVSVIKVGQNFV